MGTPLQVADESNDDVQGRSSPSPHRCSVGCSGGKVLMRGMCEGDARSGRDGEDGCDPHPRLHPRQLLSHSRLHRCPALLRGLSLHVCQTSGTCSAREYTCDECVQGLEWVEMYLEDPIMIAEFRIYL